MLHLLPATTRCSSLLRTTETTQASSACTGRRQPRACASQGCYGAHLHVLVAGTAQDGPLLGVQSPAAGGGAAAMRTAVGAGVIGDGALFQWAHGTSVAAHVLPTDNTDVLAVLPVVVPA